MNTVFKFQGAHSKQGSPAIWEKRKESQFITYVELVSDDKFKPKRPCFINRNKKISPSLHAMFVVNVGDLIIKAMRFEKTNVIKYQLYLITEIESEIVNGKTHYTHITEEQFSSNDVSEFVEKYGEDCLPVFEAAQAKLDAENIVDSFYAAPNNLLEKLAQGENSSD